MGFIFTWRRFSTQINNSSYFHNGHKIHVNSFCNLFPINYFSKCPFAHIDYLIHDHQGQFNRTTGFRSNHYKITRLHLVFYTLKPLKYANYRNLFTKCNKLLMTLFSYSSVIHHTLLLTGHLTYPLFYLSLIFEEFAQNWSLNNMSNSRSPHTSFLLGATTYFFIYETLSVRVADGCPLLNSSRTVFS